MRPAIFVNCQTTLIDDFHQLYSYSFEYRDNPALVLGTSLDSVIEPLKEFIALTLTYHARRHGKQVHQNTLVRRSSSNEDVRSKVVKFVEALLEAEANAEGNHLKLKM